ncbi:MAG: DNA translocase FtsK 4TM domain-containing protein [bacterium]|nr:DNA translocase FtsK 4TM domain-containing protein [bacterium]
MAKKNKRKKTKDSEFEEGAREGTLQAIVTVVFFVAGIFLILSAFDKAGIVGSHTYSFLSKLLGIGYFLLPLVLFMMGVSFWTYIKEGFPLVKIGGGTLFLLAGLGITNIAFEKGGGAVGNIISLPLLNFFDIYATVVILTAVFLISLLVIFETRFTVDPIRSLLSKFGRKEDDSSVVTEEEEERIDKATKEAGYDDEDGEEKEPEIKNSFAKEKKASEDSEFGLIAPFKAMHKEYKPPSLSLLEEDRGKPGVGDIKVNATIIKRTLLNFGIHVEMDEITVGPSVTRYALKPAEGVKLSRIVALQNDLSLALAAHPLRIEAPIPGKALVGIEMPNTTKATLGLGTLLKSPDYGESEKPLLVGLGKGISGKAHFANIAKMPHLLIAGTTGSGKSVTIHALITSLLYRNSMENLKLIMIDPKRVELTLYKKIPHLLTPVITEPKKAILALKWAAKEMDRRYDILESESVRDIESYHKNILEPALKKSSKKDSEADGAKLPELMPYIVVVIDELADIMSSYPREMESAIVRLAQMSRAVGIHLIISTQRPSVNVITGLIKANVPARIALQVSSQIDSRTILDTGGAEKLLGAGDMLFLSGEMGKPLRIQSAFVSENEVKNVVKYLAETYADEATQELTLSGEGENTGASSDIFNSMNEDEDIDDNLYEEARQAIVAAGKASTSYIQRKLRVGYARAARLMDMLEERGVIGPADGSRPREVFDAPSSSAIPEEVDHSQENIQPDEDENQKTYD